MDLFDYMREQNMEKEAPLASRLRPTTLEEVVGQQHIIGKDKLLYRAIKADKLSSVIFYGPPGTGKTTLAKVIANTTSAEFTQINATTAGKKDMEEVINKAKEMQGLYRKKTILFVDEIHRFNKGQQDYLLPFVEDGTIILIVATQNPVEHEGTYRLPEAQLDRFMFKILVDYPRKEEEVEILELHDKRSSESWKEQTPVVSVGELSYLREKVHDVHVDEKIKAFIVDIVGTTRDNAWLYLGASPRASIALMNSAKAFAAISGRDFVVPEDVLYLAAPVLRHRVQLSAEKELEGVVVDQVIQQLIAKVEIPR